MSEQSDRVPSFPLKLKCARSNVDFLQRAGKSIGSCVVVPRTSVRSKQHNAFQEVKWNR